MLQSSHQRVEKHRDHLRSLGLRPVQIWVPDSKALGFSEKCREQSRLLETTKEKEVLNWLDNVADRAGWE